MTIGLLALAVSGLTGCANPTTASAPKTHDPLHGIMAPPGLPMPNNPQTATGNLVSPPQGAYQGGVPAIPTTLTATNTASLAPLSSAGPLGRPLAIDDDGRARPGGDWTRPGQTLQTPVMPGFPGAATKPRVEQVPDTAGKPPIAPVGTWQTQGSFAPAVQTANSPPTSPSLSQPLDDQLKERGVLKQKVEQVPDGILLTCYLSRGPAGGIRILESTAADYPAAAQAILQQLAQETRTP